MKLRFALALLAGLSVVGTARTGQAGDGCALSGAQKDLVATAAEAGTFKTLLAAAEAAGLVDTLQGPGPFTVFAPSDDAFAKLPAGTVEALLADKTALTKVLTYHVVSGAVPASEAVTLSWAPTVEGQSLRVRVMDDAVMIDDAKVVATDIRASNGIIHVVDSVLLPRKDIVATAIEAGSFQTLVTAVKAAGLVETLQGKGPFTVFAPADSAFAKLPPGAIEKLLADKAALTNVLTYHVVPGRILAEDIAPGHTAVDAANGMRLAIHRSEDGTVTVGGAKVVATDVLAGNGIIHVVDSVILPQGQ